MKPSSIFVLIWLTGSVIAALMALQFDSAAVLNGEYVPVGNDSFYHARRILDMAVGERGFYSFDDRIYVPEGAWLNWPWGYDVAVAAALSAALAVNPDLSPMAFLAHVPVAWVFVNFALLVLVLRELGVSAPFAAIAVVATALLPLTQALHGLGMIDHHYIEWFFVLATLWLGLRFFRRAGPRDAVLLGLILGSAPAFHNGLFILEVPLLAALFAGWLKGDIPAARPVCTLAAVLLLATLLFCLPSAPFRQGQFEFWLHSWFHVYVAFGSATGLVLLARIRCSPRGIAMLAAAAVVLLLPLAGKLATGGAFLSGELAILEGVTEVKSPVVRLTEANGIRWVSSYYSSVFFLSPLLAVAFGFMAWNERSAERRYGQIFALFGVLLMLTQYRLHPFGSWVLIVGTLWIVDEAQRSSGRDVRVAAAVTVALFAFAFVPPVKNNLFRERPLGLSVDYQATHSLFKGLAAACDRRAGAVLSYTDDGHYVRYHTECGVLTNNFLMTPQHERLIREADTLLAMRPDEFRAAAPHVDYVFVRLYDIFEYTAAGRRTRSIEDIAARNAPLFVALVFADGVPDGFRLIDERRVGGDDGFAYARIFELRHD